jgi:Flp pilus assembly protein TadD
MRLADIGRQTRRFSVRIRLWYSLPFAALISLSGCASSPPTGPSGTPTPAVAPESTLDKMSSAVSSGAKKMTSWMTPEPKVVPAKDPIALANQSPKAGPDIYVSLARIHESKGNFPAATAQYQKALEIDAKDLSAILGYAHLLDRQNKLNEATAQYETAVRLHPKSAAAHNDLGLCYARRGLYDRASESLRQACALEPSRPLYRNNLATVMVEQGRSEDALREMLAVHDAATAHYNLGYLLQQKGQNQQAVRHFAEAGRLNPQLTAAQTWVAKLSPPANAGMAAAAPAQAPVQAPIRPAITAQPVSATIDAVQPPANRNHPVDRYDDAAASEAAFQSRWGGNATSVRPPATRLPSTGGAPSMDAPGPPERGR